MHWLYFPFAAIFVMCVPSPRHLLPQGRALLMLLDLPSDERGRPDGGKMISVSPPPPSSLPFSLSAATGRRSVS